VNLAGHASGVSADLFRWYVRIHRSAPDPTVQRLVCLHPGNIRLSSGFIRRHARLLAPFARLLERAASHLRVCPQESTNGAIVMTHSQSARLPFERIALRGEPSKHDGHVLAPDDASAQRLPSVTGNERAPTQSFAGLVEGGRLVRTSRRSAKRDTKVWRSSCNSAIPRQRRSTTSPSQLSPSRRIRIGTSTRPAARRPRRRTAGHFGSIRRRTTCCA
jgi:hypothetical protein